MGKNYNSEQIEYNLADEELEDIFESILLEFENRKGYLW